MLSKNDKKHNILVSGASGIVGYGILRSLREREDCFLIGTTIYPKSPANCFSDVVEIVPSTEDAGYFEAFTEIISKYSVDMIIPGIEADMSAWNKNRKALDATGTCVLLNNPSLVNLCLDKWSFYQKLDEHGYRGRIRTKIEPDFETFSIPFILKPRCGFGARGMMIVESREQFEEKKQQIGDVLMMQEYVGSDTEEYTVSAFFDSQSNIRAVMGMRRKLSGIGFTEIAEVVDVEEFIEDIHILAGIFRPVGPTNFQFRKDGTKLKLLEINPRISSSSSIRMKFGYNESRMAVDYFLEGKEVMQPVIRSGHAMRYIEDYIFYDSSDI